MKYSKSNIMEIIIKGSLANIPYVGSYISETINLKEKKESDLVLDEMLDSIINKLQDQKEVTLRGESQSSENKSLKLQHIYKKIRKTYFIDGCCPFSSHDCFINSWYSGCQDYLQSLNNSEKVMFLTMVLDSWCVDVNLYHQITSNVTAKPKHGDAEYVEKLTNKILTIISTEISTINFDYINGRDVSRLYSALGNLFFDNRDYKLSAITLINCMYFAIDNLNTDGVIEVSKASFYNDKKAISVSNISIPFYFHRIAICFQNIGMLKLAVKAQEHSYILGNKSSAFYIGSLYVSLKDYNSAAHWFRLFLEYSDNMLKPKPGVSFMNLPPSTYSERRYASYIILENSDSPSESVSCLCGSELPYTDCCKSLLSD